MLNFRPNYVTKPYIFEFIYRATFVLFCRAIDTFLKAIINKVSYFRQDGHLCKGSQPVSEPMDMERKLGLKFEGIW